MCVILQVILHLWALALSFATLKYPCSVFMNFSSRLRVQNWALNSHFSNCIVTNVDMWRERERSLESKTENKVDSCGHTIWE